MATRRNIGELINVRSIYIVFVAILSAYIAYNYGTLLRGSENALNGLMSVFSILAGVLVAVVSIVGDPSMLLPGTWRVAYEHAKDMQNRIASFSYLFFIYIVSIILLVPAMIARDVGSDKFDLLFQSLTFFSLLGLLLSIPLPFSLMAIQKERMREEIKARKPKSSAS